MSTNTVNNNILVCPLNWGLGHATRAIPIIEAALEKGYNPIIASDGEDLAPLMKQLGEKLIIQTMFVRGSINNMSIDNTTTTELNALIEFYKATQPSHIFIYSIARDTPIDTLQIVKKDELEQIANTISNHGFSVNVN